MPRVSVFIPAYNAALFIGQTIQSVIGQTFVNWELIIVDDCSTDQTVSICEEYARQDNRIKIYRNEMNLGMMGNWNKGVGLCHAEFIAKLDCDDYWSESMLQDCIVALEKDPDTGLVVTRITLIDEGGNSQGNPPMPEWARDKSFSTLGLVRQGVHGVFQDNVLKQGIGLIRRSIFDELGFFSLHPAGDTEMWYRIGAHYKIAGVDKPNYFYRIWSKSFSHYEVAVNSRSAQNLYEIRQMIFDYYYQKKLLSQDQFNRFSAENKFEYNKYRTATFRQKGDIWRAFRIFCQNFKSFPMPTLKFYSGRVIRKFIREKK